MKLIGLYGKARVGKDTAAEILAKRLQLFRYSFASPLKDMLTSVFGNHFYTGDRERICPETGVSYRVMMQTLGTEWGRSLNPDLWVNLVNKKWEEVKYQAEHADTYRAAFNAEPPKGMVLSDVRFDSEAKWIQDNGGIVIEILRSDVAKINGVEGHASELGLQTAKPDYTIGNFGNMDSLHDLLRNVIFSAYKE